MSELKTTKSNQARRTIRVRSRVKGSEGRPRLSVKISNLHVSAQVIDDVTHKTLASSTSVGAKLQSKTMTEKAVFVGTDIAKKAVKVKVKAVVFDRGSRRYHGRIKALADAARQEGLEF